MPRKRGRKQRVVLRAKRRTALAKEYKTVFIGCGLLGLAAFGMVMVSQGDGWAPRFIQRHTPTLEIQAPDTLIDLPLLKESHPASFLLWFPGAELRLRMRWLHQYPALDAVRFEKRFSDNRILVRLLPRVPLVYWDNQGLDKDGVVFTLASQRWSPLPKAAIRSSASRQALGQWLAEVSHLSEFWKQVVAITEDPRGDVWLEMQTGTQVAWGTPDIRRAREKARCLVRVLDDAHQRLSGARMADVRFFDEGRIIIRPKSAV